MMFCSKCHNDLPDCKCPDLEERLRELQASPSIRIPNCDRCHKPRPICKCDARPCAVGVKETGERCGRPTMRDPAICDRCLDRIRLGLDFTAIFQLSLSHPAAVRARQMAPRN